MPLLPVHFWEKKIIDVDSAKSKFFPAGLHESEKKSFFRKDLILGMTGYFENSAKSSPLENFSL